MSKKMRTAKKSSRKESEEGMRAESMLRDGKKLDHGTLREEGWRENE